MILRVILKNFLSFNDEVQFDMFPNMKRTTLSNHITMLDGKLPVLKMAAVYGANGAGKSTTIKMLTGLLTPTSGEIVVNGLVPNEKRIQNNKNIGAVFGQKTQLWWDLPVIESFRLIKKMFKIPENEYRKNLERFTEILDLEDLLDKQVKNLSLGQKMRCEIAATFLHNPKIVYLDEPTIGLDVFVKENIRKFIHSKKLCILRQLKPIITIYYKRRHSFNIYQDI